MLGKLNFSRISPVIDCGITCDTDDSEQIESKFCTRRLAKSLKYSHALEFEERLNGKSKRNSEKILNVSICEEIPLIYQSYNEADGVNNIYQEMMRDIEEECSHNWLPSPAFVHPQCMNFPTPKAAFSPSKPRFLRL